MVSMVMVASGLLVANDHWGVCNKIAATASNLVNNRSRVHLNRYTTDAYMHDMCANKEE